MEEGEDEYLDREAVSEHLLGGDHVETEVANGEEQPVDVN